MSEAGGVKENKGGRVLVFVCGFISPSLQRLSLARCTSNLSRCCFSILIWLLLYQWICVAYVLFHRTHLAYGAMLFCVCVGVRICVKISFQLSV